MIFCLKRLYRIRKKDNNVFIGYEAEMELYQFPTPDCMHFQGTESTDWRILLPLLVKIHAKTKLLPEKGEPPLLERNGGRKSP